jgi:hypothetical protein
MLRWLRDTFYLLKLALTSPTSGGRSVGIIRWRTKAPELLTVWDFCMCKCRNAPLHEWFGLFLKKVYFLRPVIFVHIDGYCFMCGLHIINILCCFWYFCNDLLQRCKCIFTFHLFKITCLHIQLFKGPTSVTFAYCLWSILFYTKIKTNSVVLVRKANYADRATTACRRS